MPGSSIMQGKIPILKINRLSVYLLMYNRFVATKYKSIRQKKGLNDEER